MLTTIKCVRQHLHNLNKKYLKVSPPQISNQFVSLLKKGFSEKISIKKFQNAFLKNTVWEVNFLSYQYCSHVVVYVSVNDGHC